MPENQKNEGFSIPCEDVVHVVEFCPYDLSSSLIVIGKGSTRISLGTCKFQDKDPDINEFEFKLLKDFIQGTRITAMSWSPTTSITSAPIEIRFCTGGADKKVRVFMSDLKDVNHVQELGSHRDYVNAVSYKPDTGDLVASVSDDHTCRVWSTDATQVACFPLKSPGMSVKWHEEEPHKVMVAEKLGIIRFYNITTQQVIMSLDCSQVPLVSADWCSGNSVQIAALAGTDCLVFDSSRSSRPIENKQMHADNGQVVCWSRSHDHILATQGKPGSMVKIFNAKTNQVIPLAELTVCNGMSWHRRLPYLAVGGDKRVHIIPVDV